MNLKGVWLTLEHPASYQRTFFCSSRKFYFPFFIFISFMLFWLYINKSTYIYTYMGYIFLCWTCLIFKKRSSQNIDWRCIVEKKAKKRNVCVNIHSYVYTLFLYYSWGSLGIIRFFRFFFCSFAWFFLFVCCLLFFTPQILASFYANWLIFGGKSCGKLIWFYLKWKRV